MGPGCPCPDRLFQAMAVQELYTNAHRQSPHESVLNQDAQCFQAPSPSYQHIKKSKNYKYQCQSIEK